MERSRPSQGAELAGIGGLLLILVMFLFAWFSLEAQGVDQGFDAFDAFKDWVNIILVFAAFSGMALALGARSDSLPIPLSTLTAGLGGISVILIIIYIISPPSIDFGVSGQSLDLGRKLGVWLGLISAGVVTLGGWQAMQSEGTSFGAQAERTRRRYEREEPPSAPPPPAPPGEPRV